MSDAPRLRVFNQPPGDRGIGVSVIHNKNLTFPWTVFENVETWRLIVDTTSECERIKALFSGVDEKQLALVEGVIWEAACLRVELNRLNEIVKQTGLVKLHPDNPAIQKELPVSRMIVKVRANYLNYIAKLSGVLGRSVDDEDDDLDEFV